MAEVRNLNWTVSKNKNWIHVYNRNDRQHEINSGSGNMNIIITADEATTSTETDLNGTVTFVCSEVSKTQSVSVTRCKPVGCSCDYLTLSTNIVTVPSKGYSTPTQLLTVNWPSCLIERRENPVGGTLPDWVDDIGLNSNGNPVATFEENVDPEDREVRLRVRGIIQGTSTECSKEFIVKQEGKRATCGCDYIEKVYNPSIFTPIPYNESSSHYVYTFDNECANSYNFVVDGDLMNYGKNGNRFFISYKPNQTGELNDITITPYFNAQPCTSKILSVTQAANPNPPIECDCNTLKLDRAEISIPVGESRTVTINESGSCITDTRVRSSDGSIASSTINSDTITITGIATGSTYVNVSFTCNTCEQTCDSIKIRVTVTNSTACGCGDIELSNDNVTIEEINN